MSSDIADVMKVYTRPFVTILAGDVDIGTGTFIKQERIRVLTCEHVARLDPVAYYIDGAGSTGLRPGPWCVEPSTRKDVALATVPDVEWERISSVARPIPINKFAKRHEPVENELLFFRGIAGENVGYIGNLGSDSILSACCSQEKHGTGDSDIFEILWSPKDITVSQGTNGAVLDRIKYDNPAGFSGSLVWNTRFVELGCDFRNWNPDHAVVTGLLRRYEENTSTLLTWRIEHLFDWLQTSTDT